MDVLCSKNMKRNERQDLCVAAGSSWLLYRFSRRSAQAQGQELGDSGPGARGKMPFFSPSLVYSVLCGFNLDHLLIFLASWRIASHCLALSLVGHNRGLGHHASSSRKRWPGEQSRQRASTMLPTALDFPTWQRGGFCRVASSPARERLCLPSKTL